MEGGTIATLCGHLSQPSSRCSITFAPRRRRSCRLPLRSFPHTSCPETWTGEWNRRAAWGRACLALAATRVCDLRELDNYALERLRLGGLRKSVIWVPRCGMSIQKFVHLLKPGSFCGREYWSNRGYSTRDSR